MKSRLKLKVCEARQRGVEFKDEVQIETESLWWDLKMKFRLRLKVCEARQRGAEFKDEVEFKDEIQIETEGL